MKDVKIVIGANYGDEGKGLLTRYFAKQVNNPIINESKILPPINLLNVILL